MVREQRKVVTVVFADVVGSTSFAAENDPEVVRSRMSRYFKRVTEISEAYGGTVEKFAGDSAMVVFGVPAVHDDDAERAVRAALEISHGAADLPVRVGVNTGEAVAASSEDRQFMVSGDAVNVAARLQQGADAGQVLVGRLTHQLTRNVIEYEPHDPVSARGKSEALVAFRAVRPMSQVPTQARGVPGLHAELVGRNRELRLLLDTFARTEEDLHPHLFTLVGSAGVGKSRLVAEALASLASSGARVLRGRCLPYGRGITYWPLIEMVQQDTGISLSDERGAALQKLDRWLGESMGDDGQRPATRARLSVMLGLEAPEAVMPDTAPDSVAKEISWGLRRYLESVAKIAPLIVVVDDLQWAEPQVVTIFEQLAERLEQVSVLIVCIARPEFLESRRDWSSGQANSTTITLDPLSPSETSTLISRLLEIEALPVELRDQIIARSAGTPLFCEEFIHMLIDDGRLVQDGESWHATGEMATIQVPESINAVLSARLDGLPDLEKRMLQAASVVGERFELRQVRNLTGGMEIEPALDSLRRKGLVAFSEGSDGDLHFRHLLIRDAAYASVPKSERAHLHDRFGSDLEREAGDPQNVAEILAYHAERALTLSTELGLEQDAIAPRARRALEWSLAMADRARQRNDIRTADAALQTARTAAALLPDAGGIALRATMMLLEAQAMVLKADYAGARKATKEAAELGERGNLLSLVAKARLAEAWILNYSDRGNLDDVRQAAARAIEACRAAGEVSDEIEARHVASNELYATGRLDEFVEVNAKLLEQAKAIGDAARAAAILERLVNVEQLRGNSGAAELYLAEAQALAERYGLRNIAMNLLRPRGVAQLLSGDFGGAEQFFLEHLAAAEEAGAVQSLVSAQRFVAYSLIYAGNYLGASQILDRALQLSEASGETWNRAELLALRARTSLELGDLDLADALIQRALEARRDEDITGSSEVYNHLGLIRLALGRDDEAEDWLRKALEVVAGSGYAWMRSIAAFDLAAFLAAHGRAEEASVLVAEYTKVCEDRGWHAWDPQAAEIRAAIATSDRATS